MSESGKNVYVTWNDGSTPGLFDIFFAASNNNGTSFNTPINLSNNTSTSFVPQIATTGSNVYVTWEDDAPGNFDILFVASNNNGSSFITPINISNTPGSSSSSQIAVSGNNVYVTWEDDAPGNFDIFVNSNERPFGAFGTSINISNNPSNSRTPQIAISS